VEDVHERLGVVSRVDIGVEKRTVTGLVTEHRGDGQGGRRSGESGDPVHVHIPGGTDAVAGQVEVIGQAGFVDGGAEALRVGPGGRHLRRDEDRSAGSGFQARYAVLEDLRPAARDPHAVPLRLGVLAHRVGGGDNGASGKFAGLLVEDVGAAHVGDRAREQRRVLAPEGVLDGAERLPDLEPGVAHGVVAEDRERHDPDIGA
ncbi:hypothetical protein ABE10_02655, partial [Bacillus toyonensis]|nr:hypothetical protein [Bacillus toyonensis]